MGIVLFYVPAMVSSILLSNNFQNHVISNDVKYFVTIHAVHPEMTVSIDKHFANFKYSLTQNATWTASENGCNF